MTDLSRLISAYFQIKPNVGDSTQAVLFGTSGHRGSSIKGTFNERHILCIAQAVSDYRAEKGIAGPLFLGIDTHALSVPAMDTALEVLVANDVDVYLDSEGGYTPTPLVSRAIISHNASDSLQADGLIITPSHNPPEDGGIKYNTPDGGPAAAGVTQWIERRANEYLYSDLKGVKREALSETTRSPNHYDFIDRYVECLTNIVDIEAIQKADLKIGVDPMGGAALAVWDAVASKFDLNIHIVNRCQGADFAFMPLDHDGKVRMDCSSSAAMANLLSIKQQFDLAFGNDPDADRHGIVDAGGLMNPNHYLAVCIDYLLSHRPDWPADLKIGKTLVSSSMIDRIVAGRGKELYEVPVGFKWFVDGLNDGILGFAGEESAGASFLTFNGKPFSTDKDGIILCLLAAEMMAVTGKAPYQYYRELVETYGSPVYRRVDTPATVEQKAMYASLRSSDITADCLAGSRILSCFTEAPGNNAKIGGIKIVTEGGWLAARPSGTEALCKVYAESFINEKHLVQMLEESQQLLP